MAERGNHLLRWADRYLGIPLIYTLGLFKKNKNIFSETPRRIGVLATAAIGDTVLLSAILKDLQAQHPQAELSLFVGASNEAAAKLICSYHRLIKLPVSQPAKAIRLIRQAGHFDWWIDFGPWPRLNALLSYVARADYRVGFSSPKQYRHFVYQRAVEHRNDCHEIDNLRRLVMALNVKSESLPLFRGSEKNNSTKKANREIIIHMFPGGYLAHFKEWNPKNWVQLINHLTQQGYSIALTGAPEDASRADLIWQQCERQDQLRNFAGKMSLAQTADLLAEAALVISVNTGIMHLAAACRVPVVALNGPTSPLRWGALGPENLVINLKASSPSAGCLHLGFEYDLTDPHSLDSISVESVEAAVHKLINPQRQN